MFTAIMSDILPRMADYRRSVWHNLDSFQDGDAVGIVDKIKHLKRETNWMSTQFHKDIVSCVDLDSLHHNGGVARRQLVTWPTKLGTTTGSEANVLKILFMLHLNGKPAGGNMIIAHCFGWRKPRREIEQCIFLKEIVRDGWICATWRRLTFV